MDGTRVYCSVLTFKECPTAEFDPSRAAFNLEGEGKTLLISKALIIISHHSFIQQYKSFMKALYSIHLSKSPIPIEVSLPPA